MRVCANHRRICLPHVRKHTHRAHKNRQHLANVLVWPDENNRVDERARTAVAKACLKNAAMSFFLSLTRHWHLVLQERNTNFICPGTFTYFLGALFFLCCRCHFCSFVNPNCCILFQQTWRCGRKRNCFQRRRCMSFSVCWTAISMVRQP